MNKAPPTLPTAAATAAYRNDLDEPIGMQDYNAELSEAARRPQHAARSQLKATHQGNVSPFVQSVSVKGH